MGDRASAVLAVRSWPDGLPTLPLLSADPSATTWTATTADPGTGSVLVSAGRAGADTVACCVGPAAAAVPVPEGGLGIVPVPEGGLGIGPAAGWTGAGHTWRHEELALTASVVAHVQHDADGRALLAALRERTPVDLDTAEITELPDELADGLLVVRRQVLGGALVLRVDLARRAWGTEVLVSAVLTDPAVADDAVSALVRLLAAIGPEHDRLTA